GGTEAAQFPRGFGASFFRIESRTFKRTSGAAMRRPLHVALVHWTIKDRAGNLVCTNVTNFDIHDIARASRTYGIEKYFIVNRLKEQLSFVSRVLDHWKVGTGSEYNPKRKEALGMVELAENLDQVFAKFPVK